MSPSLRQATPDDVVGKVLRRAEVAKVISYIPTASPHLHLRAIASARISSTHLMALFLQIARKLQDRLALASYKAQNGQENLSFKDVEARLETTIKRKRTSFSFESSPTCSSSSSEQQFFSSAIASSPPSAPIFSDDIRGSGNPRISRRKNVYQSMNMEPGIHKSKRIRSCSMAPPLVEKTYRSWRHSHDLPQSSPISHRESHFSTSRGPNLSFASEISTVPDPPPIGHVSEDEGEGLRNQSFRMSITNSRSSPPRTPPPTRSRQRKINAGGEEGADLLLYLATSPSPANPGLKSSRIFAPSTPPSNNSALPSAMMHTSGMAGFNTPGQQFNFADFVNITPSPAQGAFGNRTPGPAKTPLAAREARRRLNLDSFAPPTGSPTLSNLRGAMSNESGLGMELGGELVS